MRKFRVFFQEREIANEKLPPSCFISTFILKDPMKVGGGTPYLPCNAKPYETRGKNFCPKVKVRTIKKMLIISQSFDVILCQSYFYQILYSKQKPLQLYVSIILQVQQKL